MYDERYYRYREAFREFRIEAKVLYEMLRPQASSRILEVGCGGGAFLAFLESMGHTAVGVDLLDEAVRVAKEAVSRSEVLEADAAHLPFEDGSFDRLVSHHLVEHLEDLPGALAEWRRVLAPGGLVAVCTPNILYESPRIFDDPTHVRIYDRAGLERAVKSAGFCVDRCVTIFPGLGRDRISVRVGVPLYRVFYRLPYFRDRGRSIVLGAHLG